LKNIDFDQDLTILEFGTGDGCITKEIVKRISDNSNLYSFETNSSLWVQSRNMFHKNTNVEIFNHSAFDFESVLSELKIKKVDIFISSLPLALFDNSEVTLLINKMKDFLNPQGQFIQYQYSIDKYSYLKNVFDTVQLDFTIRNVPPAFTYTYSF